MRFSPRSAVARRPSQTGRGDARRAWQLLGPIMREQAQWCCLWRGRATLNRNVFFGGSVTDDPEGLNDTIILFQPGWVRTGLFS